jgi:hypothetical protein
VSLLWSFFGFARIRQLPTGKNRFRKDYLWKMTSINGIKLFFLALVFIFYSCNNYRKPKPGEEIVHYGTGEVKEVHHIKNGKREGISEYYSIDGVLEKKETWHNNIKEGLVTLYHSNGKIKFKGYNQADHLTGPVVTFDESGRLMGQGTMINDSVYSEMRAYDDYGHLTRIETRYQDEITAYGEYDAKGNIISVLPFFRIFHKDTLRQNENDSLLFQVFNIRPIDTANVYIGEISYGNEPGENSTKIHLINFKAKYPCDTKEPGEHFIEGVVEIISVNKSDDLRAVFPFKERYIVKKN